MEIDKLKLNVELGYNKIPRFLLPYFLFFRTLKNHVFSSDFPLTSPSTDQTRGIIFLFCQFEDEKGKIDADSLVDLLRFVFEIRPAPPIHLILFIR